MEKNNNKIINLRLAFRIIAGTIILFGGTTIVNYTLNLNAMFYYGKDGGLLFRVLTFSLLGGVLFGFINKFNSRSFLIGVALGFLSYIVVFGYYIVFGVLSGGNNNYPILSPFGDHLLASVILLFLSLIVYSKKNKQKNLPRQSSI